MKVEMLSTQNIEEAKSYLLRHEETSQFLINNLNSYGATLTDHHNSGNYRIVRENDLISGVFCLTRRGNLIVQSDGDFSEIILRACESEPVQLRGFIGDWESVEPVWNRFKLANSDYKPSYESKEILYSYELRKTDSKLVHDPRVRLVERSDYTQWREHSDAYMSELHLPNELTDDQARRSFDEQIDEKSWWGLFDGKQLLSRAALNSKGDKVGQVGGVFTPKRYRQKGYAKATMFHMLTDCRDLHGHSKSILFTGETDVPAQKLYESMGYQRIGYFAVILGSREMKGTEHGKATPT